MACASLELRDGFCVFENVLDAGTVAKLNAMSEWTIAQEDAEHFERHRAQGCIISYWKFPHPAFAELLADPRALAVFADLGFESPRVWSGFLISKPPHAPPLYWHQDGVLWDHPISYTDRPQQYFLMYYLAWRRCGPTAAWPGRRSLCANSRRAKTWTTARWTTSATPASSASTPQTKTPSAPTATRAPDRRCTS